MTTDNMDNLDEINIDDGRGDDDLDNDNNGDNPVEFPCQLLTGAAGTGKTYQLQQRIADGERIVLTATTGIAAVNLGPGIRTINSTLGFFDADSLMDSFIAGRAQRGLQRLIEEEQADWIAIDEISMLGKEVLDLIYKIFEEVNGRRIEMGEKVVGLLLTGDFCQLPPIKQEFCFNANCWPKFAQNTIKLTKVWRQDNAIFLQALNAARQGNGPDTVRYLREARVNFVGSVDMNFDGTTIMAKNDAVDRLNMLRLMQVNGRAITLTSTRWGLARDEWKNIPNQFEVRVGAKVMILANDLPGFRYVNGSLGTVEGTGKDPESEQSFVRVKLDTGDLVEIKRLTRQTTSIHAPDEWKGRQEGWPTERGKGAFYDLSRKRWVLGELSYYPIRLAYAATCHRSQGLTMDSVQVDFNDGFFGQPAMAYVALSRCRTPAGLRIVGSPDLVMRRVRCEQKVREWL